MEKIKIIFAKALRILWFNKSYKYCKTYYTPYVNFNFVVLILLDQISEYLEVHRAYGMNPFGGGVSGGTNGSGVVVLVKEDEFCDAESVFVCIDFSMIK